MFASHSKVHCGHAFSSIGFGGFGIGSGMTTGSGFILIAILLPQLSQNKAPSSFIILQLAHSRLFITAGTGSGLSIFFLFKKS